MVPRGDVLQFCDFNGLRLPTQSDAFIELQYVLNRFPNPITGRCQSGITGALKFDSPLGRRFDSGATESAVPPESGPNIRSCEWSLGANEATSPFRLIALMA
jgi:hypothetical protein